MNRLLTFLVIAGLAGCAPSLLSPRIRTAATQQTISVSPYPHLKSRIDALLADSLFPPAHVGVNIVSLARDEVLYALQPGFLFHPASNQKLFTSAAALALLGDHYQFVTRVFIDSLERSTILIRGSGDPLLTTNDLDTMAAIIAQHVHHGKPWRLAGDVSLFDDFSWGRGWMWDDEPAPSVMFISPLSINRNCVQVRVRPGMAAGEPVIVTTIPPTNFVTVENTARTIAASNADSLVVSRDPRDPLNLIKVGGTLSITDTAYAEEVTVRKPEEFFLTLLSERLTAHGVMIEGIGLETVQGLKDPAITLSRRLDSVVTRMNKESDNLCAEVLLKTLGAESSHAPGTGRRGASAIQRFLAMSGIDTTMVVIADGSGVSRYNLSSPSAIVEVLRRMHKDPEHFGSFYESLPIAGVDGTLSERMKGTSAEGNLRAKTGTLEGVSSLSGYVRTADGELLAFSILMENFSSGPKQYRQVQDSIAVVLSVLRRDSLEGSQQLFGQ